MATPSRASSVLREPAAASPAAGTRNRIACQACARLKVTCDRNNPCSRCTARKSTCVSRYTRRQRQLPQSKTRTTRNTASAFGDVGSSAIKGSVDCSVHTSDDGIVLEDPGTNNNTESWGPISGSDDSSTTCFPDLPSTIPPSGNDSSFRESLPSQNQDSGFVSYSPRSSPDHFMDIWIDDLKPNILLEQPPKPNNVGQRQESMPRGSISVEEAVEIDTYGSMVENDAPNEVQWTSFRCNPTSHPMFLGASRYSLEGLTESLTLHDTKLPKSWSKSVDEFDVNCRCTIKVYSISNCTRDQLLALNHAFSERALALDQALPFASSRFRNLFRADQPNDIEDAVKTLPSMEVLVALLRSYVFRIEGSYPSISAGLLDANALMRAGPKHGALHLLLMLALGSLTSPAPTSRQLAKALTETCRVRIVEALERSQDTDRALIPSVLRSALLFTLLAMWSGDKWYMDCTFAQPALYLPMLRRVLIMDRQPSIFDETQSSQQLDRDWSSWRSHESENRLWFSFMTAILETSMFHNVTVPVSIKDVEHAEPASDRLWHADSAAAWLATYEDINKQPRDEPLLTWFRNTTRDELLHTTRRLEPTQLRFLLNFMSVSINSARQLEDALASIPDQTIPPDLITSSIDLNRKALLRSLLSRWYNLCRQHTSTIPNDDVLQMVMTTNLIMYNLLRLETLVCFSSLEAIARDGSHWDSATLCSTLVPHLQETRLHCAQLLRLTRSAMSHLRPLWWPAAIYRAAIIAWACALAQKHQRATSVDDISLPGSPAMAEDVALDTIALGETNAEGRHQSPFGRPCLTSRDGRLTSLDDSKAIVPIFIEELEAEGDLRFAQGIKNKLVEFSKRWNI